MEVRTARTQNPRDLGGHRFLQAVFEQGGKTVEAIARSKLAAAKGKRRRRPPRNGSPEAAGGVRQPARIEVDPMKIAGRQPEAEQVGQEAAFAAADLEHPRAFRGKTPSRSSKAAAARLRPPVMNNSAAFSGA